MDHVECRSGGSVVLNDLSFQVFAGEIYGILMLERTGSREMMELIGRNRPMDHGKIYFNEHLVASPEVKKWGVGDVAVIGRTSHLIDELSLADNIFVIRPGFQNFYIHERKVTRQTRALTEKYGIALDIGKPASQLQPYERILAELLRAVAIGAKLIVLRDIPEILGEQELKSFHRFLRQMAGEGITFLYTYNHHEVLNTVCDRMAVFKGGRVEIVLDCGVSLQEQIRILSNHAVRELQSMEKATSDRVHNSVPSVRLSHVFYGALQDFSMDIYPGEVVLLIDQSNTVLRDIMDLFTQLNQKKKVPGVLSKKKMNVSLIEQDPLRTMLFWERSVMENLCFLLGDKIPFFWFRKRLYRHVKRECRQELGDIVDAQELYGLHSRELYTIVYARCLLVRPDLVICMQPMIGRDMYLRTHILRLITRLSQEGIPVLILTPNLFDTIFVADRVLQVENGHVASEHVRGEFDKIPLRMQDLFSEY